MSGLGNLPLIGKSFADNQSLSLTFQPVLTSDASFDWGSITLPEGAPSIPAELSATGADAAGSTTTTTPPDGKTGSSVKFMMATTLRVAGKTFSITFGSSPESPNDLSNDDPVLNPTSADALATETTSSDSGSLSTPNEQAPTPPAGGADAPDPGSDFPSGGSTSDSDAKWIEINKKFGPVQVRRVGLGFNQGGTNADGDREGGSIAILLDCGMMLGPLNVSLMGLGAAYSLESKDLSFSLDGMSISANTQPRGPSG